MGVRPHRLAALERRKETRASESSMLPGKSPGVGVGGGVGVGDEEEGAVAALVVAVVEVVFLLVRVPPSSLSLASSFLSPGSTSTRTTISATWSGSELSSVASPKRRRTRTRSASVSGRDAADAEVGESSCWERARVVRVVRRGWLGVRGGYEVEAGGKGAAPEEQRGCGGVR